MANPQQAQGALPPPARAQGGLVIPHEATFYEFMKVEREVGLPLPKKAPKIEAKQWPFDKHRDTTGSELGDLHKRGIYQLQDIIGDKRREALHLLPFNKRNKAQLSQLRNQLDGLNEKLVKKIEDMRRATSIVLVFPPHFENFPELEA